MAQLLIKVKGIPRSLEREFGRALDKVAVGMVENARIAMAKQILEKSLLTEEQAKELAREVKEGIAKRHGL